MENQPLISIAVPAYNSERFIDSCLQSLITQTYKNLEIIVINNGSVDDTLRIIQEHANGDKRVKYYTIDHVPTEAWSRNNAYIRTTAEWVIPIDSDDTVEPEYVEKLWKRHLETGAEWIGPTMTFLDSEGHIHGRIPNEHFDYSQVLVGKDSVILTLNGWEIGANGALIHRHLVPCIEFGETKPLYNVEYDTRVILYNAKTVAFADAKYYFGYNPNSVGRKPSYSKVTYVLQSFTGLLPFIQQNYDWDSEEVKVTSGVSASLLFYAFKNYYCNKDTFTKEQRIEYKKMCKSLYANLHFSHVKEPIVKKTVKMAIILLNIFLFRIF